MKTLEVSPGVYVAGDYIIKRLTGGKWRLGRPADADNPLAADLLTGSTSDHATYAECVRVVARRQRARAWVYGGGSRG